MYHNDTAPDIVERIRVLWVEKGCSSGFIVRRLAGQNMFMSRSAVMGTIHRRGFKRAVTVNQENRVKPHRSPRAPRPKRIFNQTPSREEWHLPAMKEGNSFSLLPSPISLLVPFNETTNFQCHWVEKDVSPSYDMPCCGAPVTSDLGIWYCPAHLRAAYRKVPKRREIRPARR